MQHTKPKTVLQQSKVLAGGVQQDRPNKSDTGVKLPMIEVKSMAPYDNSILMGIKIPESIRGEIIRNQQHRRLSKKFLEEKTRLKIQSSNNLKLKYEE
jgi:hypothetical protein